MFKRILTLKPACNHLLPVSSLSLVSTHCYASGAVFTTVTDVCGSVEASVVSAGCVGHGNENSLGYPNKPPAEPACNCHLLLLE